MNTEIKNTTANAPVEAADMIDLAENAVRVRRAAPEVTTSGRVTVPQKTLMKAFIKDAGESGQDDKYHYSFVEEKEIRIRAMQGRIPCVGKDGRLIRYNETVMVKVPKDIWDQKRSKAKLLDERQVDTKMGDANPCCADESRKLVKRVPKTAYGMGKRDKGEPADKAD